MSCHCGRSNVEEGAADLLYIAHQFGVKCHHHSPSHLSPRQVGTGLWSTASDDMLSLVAGSLLGLGGGCFLEVGLPTSSSPPPPVFPPPTEWRDWERTEKPCPQAMVCRWGIGMRSWGSGMVFAPIRKCLPSVAMSSPVLKQPKRRGGEKKRVKLCQSRHSHQPLFEWSHVNVFRWVHVAKMTRALR